jgi:Tfp pilus assembly protein PilE
MVKPKPIIITSGILVLAGIAITAYQSQITSENLSNEQNTLGIGAQMTVTKEMNPYNNQNGVYSIQITDFKDNDNVKATVSDPVGIPIITKSITKSPVQEMFKISASGNYTLEIKNQGQREIQVLGIIGYYPQGIEWADISGFIVLMIGLSGLAIGIMYLIRNRVKS